LGAASGSLGQDVSRSMTYPVGTPWRTHSCAMPLRVCHEITCSFVANRSLTVAALKAQRSRDREGAVGTVISERPLRFPVRETPQKTVCEHRINTRASRQVGTRHAKAYATAAGSSPGSVPAPRLVFRSTCRA
jgi:hypothetical protein